MTRQWRTYVAGACWLLLAVAARPGVWCEVGAAEASKAEIMIVVGPCQHPPGTHEAAAGARLLEYCVENAANVEPVRAEVYYEIQRLIHEDVAYDWTFVPNIWQTANSRVGNFNPGAAWVFYGYTDYVHEWTLEGGE